MSVTNEAATAVGVGTRRGNFLIWLAALGIVAAAAVGIDAMVSDRSDSPATGVQGAEAPDTGLTRGQQAEASRLGGIAGVYERMAEKLERSKAAQIAESERLEGLAEHYGATVEPEPATFEFFGPLTPYAEQSGLGDIDFSQYGLPEPGLWTTP